MRDECAIAACVSMSLASLTPPAYCILSLSALSSHILYTSFRCGRLQELQKKLQGMLKVQHGEKVLSREALMNQTINEYSVSPFVLYCMLSMHVSNILIALFKQYR